MGMEWKEPRALGLGWREGPSGGEALQLRPRWASSPGSSRAQAVGEGGAGGSPAHVGQLPVWGPRSSSCGRASGRPGPPTPPPPHSAPQPHTLFQNFPGDPALAPDNPLPGRRPTSGPPGPHPVYQAAPSHAPGHPDPPLAAEQSHLPPGPAWPAGAAGQARDVSRLSAEATSASLPDNGGPLSPPLLPSAADNSSCIIFSHSISTIIPLK